jgi:hypothetical protein
MHETTGHMGDPVISPLLVGFAFHRPKLFARATFQGTGRELMNQRETEQVSFRKHPETLA